MRKRVALMSRKDFDGSSDLQHDLICFKGVEAKKQCVRRTEPDIREGALTVAQTYSLARFPLWLDSARASMQEAKYAP
jgi:hypothetical protein